MYSNLFSTFTNRFARSSMLDAAVKASLLTAALLCSGFAGAQSDINDQLSLAREAVAKRNWSSAETILKPLVQSQPKNPFVLYDLAQVYENTNRTEEAKQIYTGLVNTLQGNPSQYTVVVRQPYASRLVTLQSLAQSKLNAIVAKQAVAVTPPAQPATSPAASPAVAVAATASLPEASRPAASHVAVADALKQWATAWADKDIPLYYASYTADFRGTFATRRAWEQQRQINISRAKTIQIDVDGITYKTVSPTQVEARFAQHYQSNLIKEHTYKVMMFTLKDGKWLIESERIQK